MKKLGLLLILLLIVSTQAKAQGDPELNGVATIIIDAGHGGKDPGNLGTGRYATKEKDIALAVALRVGEYLEENLPQVKVVYTRKKDEFITLKGRTEIANEAGGDLFVSIHCDAFVRSSAFGSTSLVLGRNHGDENRIALQENLVIKLEDDYQQRYEGFDPNDPASFIGLYMIQGIYINESIELAKMIQDQFRERVQRRDRGVKQQPLYVTSRVAMPAVLVELGFLTNPAEEDFLNSEKGQSYMASAIFRAIRDYKIKQDQLLADRVRNRGPFNELEQSDSQKENAEPSLELVPEPSPKEEPVLAQKNESPPKRLDKDETQPQASQANKPIENLAQDEKSDEVYLAVQILTLSTRKLSGNPAFKGVPVEIISESGLYKYYTGKTKSYQEAQSTAQAMREKGFKGAFVIGLNGGKRISATEARKLLR